MKHFFLTLFLAMFVFAGTQAQYRKMELFEMALGADLIVKGKISDLEPLRFTLEISSVLRGDYSEKTISVLRFINTKFAKRWGKYTVGEELVLFLKKDGEHYKVMGDGGEGEKLVLGEEICIDSRGEGLKNRFGYHATPTGANIYAEKVPLADFMGVSKELSTCYTISWIERDGGFGKMEQYPVVASACPETKKDELRSISWVYDVAISQAEKNIRGAQ